VLTLVEGGLAARIDRGAGVTLIEQRTIVNTAALDPDAVASSVAERTELAELVGNLAAPSGRDVTEALDALDVRFVLLTSPAAGASGAASRAASGAAGTSATGASGAAGDSVTAALDGNVVLTPIGNADAGRLWRVVPADDVSAATAARPPSTPIVLGVQLGILALTLLLALPTSLRPRRSRSDGRADDSPAPTFEAGDDDD